MLLADAERQTIEDLKANVAFFVNAVVATVAAAAIFVGDALANAAGLELTVRVFAAVLVAAALSAVFYEWSVGAVVRWGTGVRSAFDLHRFDLLDRLGVKAPQNQAEEKAISEAVNRCLLFAEPVPNTLRKPPEPQVTP